MSTIVEHNVETNEIIEREMTPNELAQLESDKIESEAKIAAELQAHLKRTEAEAKLSALGLTVDDLKVLGLK